MKVGDTVQLKSGGPIMTIELIEQGKVHCVWFDNKNAQQRGAFPEAALRMEEDDDTPGSFEVG